jgi:hypothetical protein
VTAEKVRVADTHNLHRRRYAAEHGDEPDKTPRRIEGEIDRFLVRDDHRVLPARN